jgi:4-hydroxy-3-polyprenylbenzoate decarboxylase
MTARPQHPLVVGITGASGSLYGVRLLRALRHLELETHLILTEPAQITLGLETDVTVAEVTALADHVHAPDDLAATIASGSFPTGGMVVAPCSIKTLSSIAHSHSDNLLTRAADVTLKEGRPLALLVRETPLHLGHLRLMVKATEMGAVIFPPVPAFYAQPRSFDDLVDQTVGRVLARVGIPNELYRRWEGPM